MKKAKMALWAIAMIVFAAMLFRSVMFCLENKGAHNRNGDFFRVADECDVLFLGTSHMATEVLPLELWHDYGITSYNIAGLGQLMPVSYWMLINALDYANPKVVLVDCYAIEADAVANDGEFMHMSMDGLPLTKTKIRAVCDLYDDMDRRIEYLWNFSIYHNRWDELTWKDFDSRYDNMRGAQFQVALCEPAPFILRDVEPEPVDSVGVKYLRKIMEECRRRDIKVVLTYLPFPANESEQKVAAYVGQFAQEYGVDYLNFLKLNVVDFKTDCLDANSHLNISGGHKITSYIGKYLSEECGIVNRRRDGIVDWDEDYAGYQRYKVERLQGLESLQNSLIMMADKSFSLCLYVDGESKIWDYEQYVNLVQNLAPEYAFPTLGEIMGQGVDYLLLLDNKNRVIKEFGGEESGETETSFGKVVYTKTEAGERVLYLGGSEENLLVEEDENGHKLTVQTILIDHSDGSIINLQKFQETLKATK